MQQPCGCFRSHAGRLSLQKALCPNPPAQSNTTEHLRDGVQSNLHPDALCILEPQKQGRQQLLVNVELQGAASRDNTTQQQQCTSVIYSNQRARKRHARQYCVQVVLK